MNLEIVPISRKEFLREYGILFVRNDCIFYTMVKVSLLIASVIIVAVMIPIHSSLGSSRTLDLIVYPDGSTHISTQIDVDPLANNYELELFGSTIDNLVVVDENEFLLDVDILDDSALITTFGSSIIFVDYDIHDLVSKQSRVWTFSLNSPSDFTLLLPKNSAIVGMTNLPIDMQLINEQNLLTLSSGETEIDYLFSTYNISTPLEQTDTTLNFDYFLYLLIGGIVIIITIIVLMTKTKQKSVKSISETKIIDLIQKNEIIDTETIFKLKPNIREDDKEIVKFLSSKGGQVFESELRKKFLQPRTTMWRAVKRLERNGIIEIEKKDLQNLVKLRKNIEEEE